MLFQSLCPSEQIEESSLKKAVEPQKAHRTQKNQKLMLVKYFTQLMSIFSLSTSCFFYIILVPSVAICRFKDKSLK